MGGVRGSGRTLAVAVVMVGLGTVLSSCAADSGGGQISSSSTGQDYSAPQQTVNRPAPAAASRNDSISGSDSNGGSDTYSGSSGGTSNGSAGRTTCQDFSTMDANTQAVVVEQMLEEMKTGWGVATVLPNVRAMCAVYPSTTPISVTMTG